MSPLATINAYYKHIDVQDLDWVMSLFEPDAVYVRAESVYEGKSAINHFFRCERKIRGEHHVDYVHAIDNDVICRGEFVGVGDAGDVRNIMFMDLWQFRDSGLVGRRETYLALGAQYVRE